MNLSKGILFVSALAVVAVAQRSLATDLKVGDEKTFIRFGLLLQPWVALENEAAPDAESLDTDFYLRRFRILFSGQLN